MSNAVEPPLAELHANTAGELRFNPARRIKKVENKILRGM